MRRRLRALCLIGGMVPLATRVAPLAAAAAAREGDGGTALLQDDARLGTKVSLALKNQSLGEVLADLGARIHVRVVASPDTADDKVSLFLDQRTAADVMALLARQFDFRWIRRNR